MNGPMSDAFLQKRQPFRQILLIGAFLLAGCSPNHGPDVARLSRTDCDQACGKSLDERTFVCVDRCHREADYSHLP